MQVLHYFVILIVVFLMNWSVNAYLNNDRKDKDGGDISVGSTALQSFVSAMFALLLLIILFTFVFKASSETD